MDREGDYVYLTSATRNPACDANFASFEQFPTGSGGQFLFHTIKAGLYNGRTRLYHWGVTLPGRVTRSTSQTFWNEMAYDLNGSSAWATQNSSDMVDTGITDAEQRASVLLDYRPCQARRQAKCRRRGILQASSHQWNRPVPTEKT